MSKDTDGMTTGVEPDQTAPLGGDLYCLPSLYYLSKYMYHNDPNFLDVYPRANNRDPDQISPRVEV